MFYVGSHSLSFVATSFSIQGIKKKKTSKKLNAISLKCVNNYFLYETPTIKIKCIFLCFAKFQKKYKYHKIPL